MLGGSETFRGLHPEGVATIDGEFDVNAPNNEHEFGPVDPGDNGDTEPTEASAPDNQPVSDNEPTRMDLQDFDFDIYDGFDDSPGIDADANPNDPDSDPDLDGPEDTTNNETEKTPESQTFTAPYVLRGNELYPAESNDDDGTDAAKPLSESLPSDWLEEYRTTIIPALQEGESVTVEREGLSDEESITIIVTEYVVVAEDEYGNTLVDAISTLKKIPREPEPNTAPEAEEDDGWDDAAWDMPDHDIPALDQPDAFTAPEVPAAASTHLELGAQPVISTVELTQVATAAIPASSEPRPIMDTQTETTIALPEPIAQAAVTTEPQSQPLAEARPTPPVTPIQPLAETAFQPVSIAEMPTIAFPDNQPQVAYAFTEPAGTPAVLQPEITVATAPVSVPTTPESSLPQVIATSAETTPPPTRQIPEAVSTPADHSTSEIMLAAPDTKTAPDITITAPAERSNTSEPASTITAARAAEPAPQGPQSPAAPDQPDGGPGRAQEAPTATIIQPGEVSVIHQPAAEATAPIIAEAAPTTADPAVAETSTPAAPEAIANPTAESTTAPAVETATTAAEATAPITETSTPATTETIAPAVIKTTTSAPAPAQRIETPSVPTEEANHLQEAPQPVQESATHTPATDIHATVSEHYAPAAEFHAPIVDHHAPAIEKHAPATVQETNQTVAHEAPATPQVQRESTAPSFVPHEASATPIIQHESIRPTPHKSVSEPAQTKDRTPTTHEETTPATSRQKTTAPNYRREFTAPTAPVETATPISQPDIIIPIAETVAPKQTSTAQPIRAQPVTESISAPSTQFAPAEPTATRLNTAPSDTINITFAPNAPHAATAAPEVTIVGTASVKPATTPTPRAQTTTPLRSFEFGRSSAHPAPTATTTDATDSLDLTITIDAPITAGRTPRRRARTTARSTA